VKLLAALPAGALLSQRSKLTEAFAQVFEAAPYAAVWRQPLRRPA